MGVSMTVGNERLFGTLPYLIGSPAPRGPLFLGRALFHILDGLVTVIFALPLAVLFFGLDLSHSNLPLVAGCVLLLSATSTGLGLILGSISLMTQEGWFITSTISMALYILCGINFPVSALPAPLQAVAYALPMTRGIEAARMALEGATWAEVSGLVAGEAVIGLIYAMVGYGLFRLMEKRSLISGKLEAI
jgi:ABC-2 type transport system permease protein